MSELAMLKMTAGGGLDVGLPMKRQSQAAGEVFAHAMRQAEQPVRPAAKSSPDKEGGVQTADDPATKRKDETEAVDNDHEVGADDASHDDTVAASDVEDATPPDDDAGSEEHGDESDEEPDPITQSEAVAESGALTTAPAPTEASPKGEQSKAFGDAATKQPTASATGATATQADTEAKPAVPVAVVKEKPAAPTAQPARTEAATATTTTAGPAAEAPKARSDTDAQSQQQPNSHHQANAAPQSAAASTVSHASPTPTVEAAPVNPAAPQSPTPVAPHAAPAPLAAAQQPMAADGDPQALNAARVARGLQSAIAQQGGSVTLRLTPPELGTVRIQLQVQGGQVSANFQAGNESARSMLSHQLVHLRTALETQGLSVERLTVSAPQQSAAGHLQQQGQQAGQQPSSQGQPQQQQQSASDGRSRGEYQPQQQSQSQRQDGQPRDGRQSRSRFADWFDSTTHDAAA